MFELDHMMQRMTGRDDIGDQPRSKIDLEVAVAGSEGDDLKAVAMRSRHHLADHIRPLGPDAREANGLELRLDEGIGPDVPVPVSGGPQSLRTVNRQPSGRMSPPTPRDAGETACWHVTLTTFGP